MSRTYKVNSRVLTAIIGTGSRLAGNTAGALPRVQVHDVFAAPMAASVSAATSLLITAVAISDTTGATGVIIAQPDFPRNVTVWCTAANTANVTIVGTDQFDAVQTEVIAANGAAIVAGTKVFKTLTSVASANRSGSATTLSIGQGSILGTSRRIVGCGIDGGVFTTASGETTMAQETTRPVGAVTALVHGVTFNTALDPAKTYELTYFTDEAR